MQHGILYKVAHGILYKAARVSDKTEQKGCIVGPQVKFFSPT